MNAVVLAPGVKGYFQWQKALMADETTRELSREGRRQRNGVELRYTAMVIALKGENGRGCFATAETIAGEIGCSAKTVTRHRKQLIELGWFTVASRKGGKTGRALVLDISLPKPKPVVVDGFRDCDAGLHRVPAHMTWCQDCQYLRAIQAS